MPRTDGEGSPIRFFLSAALDPKVATGSAWTAVNAASRKAFAITAGDPASALIRFAGPANAAAGSSEYLDWYRQLVSKCPFLDYARNQAGEAETDVISTYGTLEDPPPIVTARGELVRTLPYGRIAQSGALPSAALLAGWLRAAAGITHIVRLHHATAALRTSPSCGARHPTDVGVRLGDAWPDSLGGSWWYEPLTHTLSSASTDHASGTVPPPPSAAVFVITSHVRRFMWRYRDPRAFAACLIDAGHVIETLLSVLAYSGWISSWQPAPGFVEVAGELDPILGHVIAWPNDELQWAAAGATIGCSGAPDNTYRTNPFLELTVAAPNIVGENHLDGRRLPMSGAMVAAASLAARAPATGADLTARCTIDDAELAALVESRFLLSEHEGERLWNMTRSWMGYGWFLSLLVHATEAAHTRVSPLPPSPRCPSVLPCLPHALDARRTSRFTNGGPLPPGTPERLVRCLTVPHPLLEIVMTNAQPLGTLQRGTYLFDEDRYDFLTAHVPTVEEVIAAAFGQPWAREFGSVIWLLPHAQRRPRSWEAALIECGRIAQDVALSVGELPDVGVFVSPAQIDERLSRLFLRKEPPDIAYIVGLGVGGEQMLTPEPRFRPSALFAS